MKRSRLIFITLFLLMLLLVLGGAFVFLFQGREQLRLQKEVAESTLAQTQQELDVTIGGLEQSTMALATAEATNLLLEEDLVESQQEADSMAATVEALDVENAAVNAQLANILGQAPSIEILAPDENSEVVVGEPFDYSFVVADSVGVTAVLVTIDGETVDAFSLVELPIAYVDGTWTPEAVGPVVVGFQASNQRTSILVTRTLTVAVPPAPITPQGGLEGLQQSSGVETAVSQIRDLRPTITGTASLVPSEETDGIETQILFPFTPDGPTQRAWTLFDFGFEDVATAFFGSIEYVPNEDVYTAALEFEESSAQRLYDYAGAFTLRLLDQNFGWQSRDRISNDAWLAQLGFAEGEMLLVQQAVLETAVFSDTNIDEIDSSLNNALSQLLSDAGAQFVQGLLDDGKYTAVNEAWAARPNSTEQLIHPEKYAEQEPPIDVELRDFLPALGDNWQLLQQATLGEALLRVYLSGQLNEMQVETAASGWGGDQYAIYQSGEQSVLVFKIVWDSLEDSTEFAALYPNYPTRLFTASGELQTGGECWRGEAEVICLYQNELETWILRAPDLETAVGLAAFLDEE